MRKIIPLLFLACFQALHSQPLFDSLFIPASLRVDYIFAGNAKETRVYLLRTRKEAHWGGTRSALIPPFDYGEFRLGLYEKETGQCIFAQGFSTLFSEWQTTADARETDRAYYGSSVVPFPRKVCDFRLFRRDRSGEFREIFLLPVDPADYFIAEESPAQCNVTRLMYHGDPSGKVDLAFLAEGYTEAEMEKFRRDAEKLSADLFAMPPFDRFRDRFNIWLVESVSQESGPDIPGEWTYQNTVFSSSYYTFDIDRYLTTDDFIRMRDYAANVPYDHMVLLINSDRYGGGGIYNHYSASTVGHQLSARVLIHELGHGLAGLGDEYYDSEVAYEDFYPAGVEPWEPNLTTLTDFRGKWKDMIAPGTLVPTPLAEPYISSVGVFEGGGYSAKGVYRPFADCIMKSNTTPGFCPVCERAIIRVIKYYTE